MDWRCYFFLFSIWITLQPSSLCPCKNNGISPIALKLAAYIYTTLQNTQSGLDGCLSLCFSPCQMYLLADLITEEQLKSHQVEIMNHSYPSVGKSHACLTCNVYEIHLSALAAKSHGPLSRWHNDKAFPGKTPCMHSRS